MASITAKRTLSVLVIVTEKFKQELLAELREAAEAAQRRIDQMEFRSRRVIADLQRADISQAMNARRQFETEKRRQEAVRQEILRELEEAEKLEMDQEYPRGTLEGMVELNSGDNLMEKLTAGQIVVKDGAIVEIRNA